MKKTLLATAIAASMAATAAQAATVYDQDGTKVDIYGRLAYAITAGGPESVNLDGRSATSVDGIVVNSYQEKGTGSEFDDLGSRFGFRASTEVSQDLSVYARMEFRGDGDAENTDGFSTVRNTYVGVNSKSWGDVMIGSFDSVYYRSGGVLFDVPENAGWANLGGIAAGSRGDSISYSTPSLSGFRAHVQAKHLSGNGAEAGAADNSATWTTAAAVDYTLNNLYMSLAYNQGKDVSDVGASHDNGKGGGFSAGEDLVGFFASYQVTPEFSARIKYEEITDTFSQDELDADLLARSQDFEDGLSDLSTSDLSDYDESIFGIGASYDYGMGEVYGDYYRISSALEGVSDRNQWVLGASYHFSDPMYVFAEMVEFDADYDEDTELGELNDDLLTTVGVRYDF